MISLLFAVLFACTTPPTGLPASGPDLAVQAGAIAKEIAVDPAKRADVLAAHGVTDVALDEALYTIAADPDLTAAYEAARK
jgi:hypothetical protein